MALGDKRSADEPTRLTRIVSKCSTKAEFAAFFRPLCSRDSIFIVTRTPRPVGTRIRFSVTLDSGSAMLTGYAEVVDSYASNGNPFRRPGMRLKFLELDDASRALLHSIVAAPPPPKNVNLAEATPPPIKPPPPIPPARGSRVSMPKGTLPMMLPKQAPGPAPASDPVPNRNSARASEPATPVPALPRPSRTPSSGYILPANPLGDLTDENLEAFVECTFYEETAGFGLPPFEPAEATPNPDEPGRARTRRASDEAAQLALEMSAVPEFVRPTTASLPGSAPVPVPAPAPVPVPVPVASIAAAPFARLPRLPSWRKQWTVPASCLAIGLLAGYILRSPGATVDKPAAASEHAAPPPAPERAPAAATPTPAIVPGAPCSLRVTSEPEGAMVSIDGQDIGATPLDREVACGSVSLSVARAQYKLESQIVRFSPGVKQELAFTLRRPSHELRMMVNPPDATVSVNGQPLESGDSVELPGFERATVEVQKPGYHAITKSVYVGKPLTVVPLTLRPARKRR